MKKKNLKGSPPPTLTGQIPVSSLDSQWWDQIALRVSSDTNLIGKVFTIEELSQMNILRYKDGAYPRGKTIARRLKPILELISRGPNGSLGKGAIYKIKGAIIVKEDIQIRGDIKNVEIAVADEWLKESIERMTKGK